MVSLGAASRLPPLFSLLMQLTGIRSAMPIIKFIKEKKEIEVPRGANLRKAAIDAGINLYQGINGFGASINKVFNCHGLGQCGMCRVLITKGMENVNPMGGMESFKFRVPLPDPMAALAYVGHEQTMRLACYTEVNGDIEVETGPEIDLFGENFFS
jgi:ferredoxin